MDFDKEKIKKFLNDGNIIFLGEDEAEKVRNFGWLINSGIARRPVWDMEWFDEYGRWNGKPMGHWAYAYIYHTGTWNLLANGAHELNVKTIAPLEYFIEDGTDDPDVSLSLLYDFIQ